MNRLPAFTLVEVLVSLFLVALLGTFAVMALGNTAQELHGFDGTSSRRLNVLFFCTRLRGDMDRAGAITAAPEGGIAMDVAGLPVRYVVNGDSLLRLAPTGREAFLLGPVVTAVQEVPLAAGLVQEWSVRLDGGTAALIFRKDHDARTIARYITDHAHTP